MSSTTAHIQPAVLRWARESAGYDLEQAAKKARLPQKKLAAAEEGLAELTLRQAEEAARAFRRPLATLFLSQPPTEEPVEHRLLALRSEISEADESRRVLDSAGPAQAFAVFGGRAGKVIAAVDSQIEKRVDSPRHRRWIRLLAFGSIVAALFWWLLSNTHSPPGW